MIQSVAETKKQELLKNWAKYRLTLSKDEDRELLRKLELIKFQIEIASEKKLEILEVLQLYERLIIESRVLKLGFTSVNKKTKRLRKVDILFKDLCELNAKVKPALVLK